MLSVLLFIVTVSGCADGSQRQPTSLNKALDRTEAQLASLRSAAESGNGAAAYELSQYYGYVAFDFKQERHWLERSAKLKYQPAMLSLANLLAESPSPKDRVRGKKLLEQARTQNPPTRN